VAEDAEWGESPVRLRDAADADGCCDLDEDDDMGCCAQIAVHPAVELSPARAQAGQDDGVFCGCCGVGCCGAEEEEEDSEAPAAVVVAVEGTH
jgi:hypothetical protein